MMPAHATERAKARIRAKRVFRFIDLATDTGILRIEAIVVEYVTSAWGGCLGSKKGIVSLLLGDARERAMAAGDDRVARQREDLFHVVPVLVPQVRGASADRAREERVANDGQG